MPLPIQHNTWVNVLSYLLSRCQVLVKSRHIHNLAWQVYVWNIMAPPPALIYTPCFQITSPTQDGSAHFRIFLTSFLYCDQKWKQGNRLYLGEWSNMWNTGIHFVLSGLMCFLSWRDSEWGLTLEPSTSASPIFLREAGPGSPGPLPWPRPHPISAKVGLL